VRLEEEAYRVKFPEDAKGKAAKDGSKPRKEPKEKREAYGGIP
jgi:hypothetical protein